MVLNKLPYQAKATHGPIVSDAMLTGEPATPDNSAAVSRLIRQTKVQVAKESDGATREGLLTSLIERLARFGISREKDHQLVKQSFEQWQEANKLNVGVDTRHLGTKKQNLARILDGKEIARLYDERERKELEKTQKRARGETRASKRASTVPLRSSLANTLPHPRRKHRQTRFQTPSPPPIDLESDEEVSIDDSILSTITVQTPAPTIPIPPLGRPTPTPKSPLPPMRCISRGPTPISPGRRTLRPRR